MFIEMELYDDNCDPVTSAGKDQFGYGLNYHPLTISNTYRIRIGRKIAGPSLYTLCLSTFAQPVGACDPTSCNIVSNPSFEANNAIPGGNQFSTFDFEVTCWRGALGGTSDYYEGNGVYGIDWGNIGVNETPHTGNAFGGIITYDSLGTTMGGFTWREYVQGQLTQPLQTGKQYRVSFWLSLKENSIYASGDFGILFGWNPQPSHPNSPPFNMCNFTPHIVWPSIVTQTNGWVELVDTITVTGALNGATYFIIGSFSNDANIPLQRTSVVAVNDIRLAYYYIDDVSIEPIINYQITQQPSPACQYTPVEFAITPHAYDSYYGIIDYAWSSSQGTINCINAGCDTMTFSNEFSDTTFFMVIASPYTGCLDTLHDTLVPWPAPIALPVGPQSACEDSAYYANSDIDPSVVYTWAVWDDLYANAVSYTTVGDSILVDWFNDNNSEAGHVILTATDTNGCTVTDTIDIVTCCRNPSTGAFIYNDTLSVLLGPGPHTRTSANWYINGYLVVDERLKFITSTLHMAGNASIRVLGSNTLELQETVVRGSCCSMWDAIEGMTVNDSIIIHDRSYVGDGIQGIVSTSCSVYRIYDDVTFNRNLHDITVKPCAATHGGSVRETEFTSDEPTYCGGGDSLMSPYAGQYPMYGMKITDVNNIVVGDSAQASYKNTFRDHRVGIRTLRTNAVVVNNEFRDITKMSAGKAIWSAGRYPTITPFNLTQYKTRVGGWGTYARNYFYNVPRGIVTDTCVGTIARANKFEQLSSYVGSDYVSGWAINVNRCNGVMQTVLVERDSIINFQEGYVGYLNHLSNSTIQYNYITRNTTTTTASQAQVCRGVLLVGATANSGTNKVFSNDLVELRYGVGVKNLNNVVVDNNYITIRPTTSLIYQAHGVRTHNCVNTAVTSNTISSTSTTTSNWIGAILMTQSPNSKVTCNITGRTGYGIQFSGPNNSPSTVYRNDLANHRHGIWLSNGAVIGPQGTTSNVAQDNKWGGTITNRLYTSGPLQTNGGLSGFYYRPVPPAGAQYQPSPTANAINSLPIIVTPTTSTNPTQVLCVYAPPALDLVDFRQNVALAQLGFTDNQVPGDWLSRQGLYRQFLLDSTLMAGDSILIAFKDSADSSNVGVFERALQVQGKGYQSSAGEIANAQSQLASVTPANDVEAYHKVVQEIMLAHFNLDGIFSNQELDTLRAIAQMCPYIEGTAVYMARALLLPFDTTEYANTCERDTGASARFGRPSVDPSAASFKLYPNPSNGQVTVEYELEKGEHGILEIYSLTGSKVASYQLSAESGTSNFTTGSLDAGVYLYRFFVNGEPRESNRLVIIK